MKLYVPRVGDQIKLTKDWRFKNQKEYRTDEFIKKYLEYENSQQLDEHDVFSDLAVGTDKNLKSGDKIDIVVPRGTILSFDRVYIRKGTSSGWDSVTFRIKSCPIKQFDKSRFWVKIEDANKIEYDLVGTKDILSPNVEIVDLQSYYCKKGRSSYFYSIDVDDFQKILNDRVSIAYHDVHVNGVREYICKVARLYGDAECDQKLEQYNQSSNFKVSLDLKIESLSFTLTKLDGTELFKVGAYSTMKKKIKEQYIKDKLNQ